jgi:Pro-kumamolisin, activation domain
VPMLWPKRESKHHQAQFIQLQSPSLSLVLAPLWLPNPLDNTLVRMKHIVLVAALLASADAAGKIFATRRGSKHASHKLQAVDPASNIQFKLHFKQCNLNGLDAAATAVSDPENKRYGKYLSSTEACQMTQCPDTPTAISAVSNFAAQADGAVMTVGCDHVQLSMSAGTCLLQVLVFQIYQFTAISCILLWLHRSCYETDA